MLQPTFILAASLAIAAALSTAPAAADDRDDSIGGDTAIKDDLQPSTNANFYMQKAQGRADKNKPPPEGVTNDGVGNINIGAGTNLKGATIVNISTNKNTEVISKGK
jgi:hypothetical protein